MRLKKLYVPILSALLACLMAFSLAACGGDKDENEYFETETKFYWDIGGMTNTGVPALIQDGWFIFKADGEFEWDFLSDNPVTAGKITKLNGTYKLSDNGSKITMTRAGNDYGPYELTKAGSGLKFGYRFYEFFPGIDFEEDCVYYSDTTQITPLPEFTYPTALFDEDAKIFEEATFFTLDLATSCGTLESVTSGTLTFSTDGSFNLTITSPDIALLQSFGAYSLIYENNALIGINYIYGSSAIGKVPFFKDLTKSDIVTISVEEKEATNGSSYMILYYKTLDSVFESAFYTNANFIPDAGTYPEVLGTESVFTAKKTLAGAAGKYSLYTNGRFNFTPSALGELGGLTALEGFYNIKKDGETQTLCLLVDGDTTVGDIKEYTLTVTKNKYSFAISSDPLIEFVEETDEVDYPEALGELIPFDSKIKFVEANSENPMSITFNPNGTVTGVHPAIGAFTGFYNLNETKDGIKFITTAMGGALDPNDFLALSKNGENKLTFTWSLGAPVLFIEE